VEHIQLHRFASQRLPLPTKPWVPALICALSAGALLGLGFAGGFGGRDLLAAPISVALLGLVLAAQSAHDRRRLRTEADGWIARGYENPRSRYGWRVEELTSTYERRLLAASLRSIVRECEQRGLTPTAVPLDRKALRPCRAHIAALADRLEALRRPVSAAGVLGVRRLITDGASSPLYVHDFSPVRERDIAGELESLLDSLEVRR
jgi:hypothetical protein